MARLVDCAHRRDECVKHVSNVTTNVQIAVSLRLCFCCFSFSARFILRFSCHEIAAPSATDELAANVYSLLLFSLDVYSFFRICAYIPSDSIRSEERNKKRENCPRRDFASGKQESQ